MNNQDRGADEITEADGSIGGLSFGAGNPSNRMVEGFRQAFLFEMVNHSGGQLRLTNGSLQLDHVIVLCVYHQCHAELPGPYHDLQHIPVTDFPGFIRHVYLASAPLLSYLRQHTLILEIPSLWKRWGSSSSRIFSLGLVNMI